MADECEADVVGAGPFVVLREGQDNLGRECLAGENSQDLGLGEMGVVEYDEEDLRVAFGEERACDPGGTAPSEGHFLAEWKLREAAEELLLGDAFYFAGCARE